MVDSTETCHFWLGYFPDEDTAYEYFEEVYDENDEDREYTPLSKFAASQGETWYDHDFIECGYNDKARSIGELVEGHSYSDQYAKELEEKSKLLGLSNINFIIFITDREIQNPVSVKNGSFSLNYVGKITYNI